MGRGYKRKQAGRNSGPAINKKQKSHLKEFGELHPADEPDDSKQQYRRVEDVADDDPVGNEIGNSSESESVEESDTPFQKLLSTMGSSNKSHAEGSESELESEADTGEEVTNPVTLAEKDGGSSQSGPPDVGRDADENSKDPDEDSEEDSDEGDSVESDEDIFKNKDESEDEDSILLKETDPFSIHFEKDLSEEFVSELEEAGGPWETEEVKDLYHVDESTEKLEETRLVYCTHALNHVLKTRSRVIAHNLKLKSKGEDVNEDHRDQGLTRPKVLIVVPFRESASRIVNMFISLIHKGDQSTVMNRKKFVEEFKEEDDVDNSDMKKKPEDYQARFQGNTDDHFRIGLSVARKSLKLYSKFYSSDIIVASPLGLRTVIGADGEDDRDFDFLSSIEMLIFDQTDIFLMQNWDHILHLVKHLHLQPKDGHGVDFSRVRMWTLNGWSKFYRQTIILSGLSSPEINGIFNKHCHNYAGKVLVPKVYPSGAICHIVTQLPQLFMKIECQTYTQLANVRFDFFVQKVLREHKDPVMARTMVFIPSYFDYVRVRNFFKKEDIDFLSICEYTKDQKMRTARKKFMRGQAHFLLYTERFHFYHRLRMRGVRHLVFYELPRYPQLYAELCNMMMGASTGATANLTCHVLYSRYDVHRLEAVVGSERAAAMVASDRPVHMFVTGDT